MSLHEVVNVSESLTSSIEYVHHKIELHCSQLPSRYSFQHGNLRFHASVSPMAVPVRTSFFLPTSAVVELPTLALLFPGLHKPADFVEPRGFCESTALGFERPTTFTARSGFPGCAGRRGGSTALLGSVSTASWPCISASTYARRSQCSIHGHCLLVHARHLTHDRFRRKYATTANTRIQTSWACLCCRGMFTQMSIEMSQKISRVSIDVGLYVSNDMYMTTVMFPDTEL